jgi:hypothetical protein
MNTFQIQGMEVKFPALVSLLEYHLKNHSEICLICRARLGGPVKFRVP